MRMVLLCLINTFLMSIGQILFKFGATGKKISNFYSLIRLFFSPIIILALALYACTTGLWLYILNKVDISFAYPIQALAYPIVLFASILIFNEQISLSRWLGVFIGVFISTR